MRANRVRAAWLGPALALVLVMGAAAPAAQAASSEPLFVFIPKSSEKEKLPGGSLSGPCGLVVDGSGKLYVSDYYHDVVDVFTPAVPLSPGGLPATYSNSLTEVDPLDGPCGLARDSSNDLYVNTYHRSVIKYNPSPSFGFGTQFPLPAEDTEHHLPTGVSVDSLDRVYVDNRTYVSVYDSSGAPIMDGSEPLRIGVGSLGNGHGIAVSQYGGTLGRVYVPDASTNTVKVYEPETSKTTPVAEIKDPLGNAFTSLRDSAIAVDRVSGDVYFADNTQPQYASKPQATIYIYGATGNYKGHLKYRVVDALQPGLTVDNSGTSTQGRVYVTSGTSIQSGVYAYEPGAGVFSQPLPPTFSLALTSSGSGEGSVRSSVKSLNCSNSCEASLLAGSEVSLSAVPEQGSEFVGWSGACSGTAPVCSVAMDEAASVNASFADLTPGASATSVTSPAAKQTVNPSHRRRHHRRRHHHRRHHRHAHHRRQPSGER